VVLAIQYRAGNKYDKHYPFGMLIQERSYTATAKGYRFGFNGYENEPDVAEEGAVIDFGARIYDSRLGRFFSTDPIVYPYWSPYQYDANSPIWQKDFLGMGLFDGFKKRAEERKIKKDAEKFEAEHKSTFETESLKEVVVAAKRPTGICGNENTLQLAYRVSTTTITNFNNEFTQKSLLDEYVTPDQLFYHWVNGTGRDAYKFNEHSVMGRLMLEAKEVQDAMDVVGDKGYWLNDFTPVSFERQLGDMENGTHPATYLLDFPNDVFFGGNEARGFHGSFTGSITIDKVIPLDNAHSVYMLTIKIKDDMTAPSATRAPPPWGYPKDGSERISIYDYNPYGPNGQFRSIKIEYELKTIMLR
jgi:RHS repeat-associated protein